MKKKVFFNHPIICEGNDTVNRLVAMPTVQPMLEFELFDAVLGFYVEDLVKKALEDRESVTYMIQIFLQSVTYNVNESKDSVYLRDVIMNSDEVGSLRQLLAQNFHDVTPQMMEMHYEETLKEDTVAGGVLMDGTIGQKTLEEYHTEMSLRMWFELLTSMNDD